MSRKKATKTKKKKQSNTYTQMFPVKLMWGQRCGLHITATTAIYDKDTIFILDKLEVLSEFKNKLKNLILLFFWHYLKIKTKAEMKQPHILKSKFLIYTVVELKSQLLFQIVWKLWVNLWKYIGVLVPSKDRKIDGKGMFLTPLAVRMGLALSLGTRARRYCGGTAAMMSTNRGCASSPYLAEVLVFTLYEQKTCCCLFVFFE